MWVMSLAKSINMQEGASIGHVADSCEILHEKISFQDENIARAQLSACFDCFCAGTKPRRKKFSHHITQKVMDAMRAFAHNVCARMQENIHGRLVVGGLNVNRKSVFAQLAILCIRQLTKKISKGNYQKNLSSSVRV